MSDGSFITYWFVAIPFLIALIPIKRKKELGWLEPFNADNSISTVGYYAIQKELGKVNTLTEFKQK